MVTIQMKGIEKNFPVGETEYSSVYLKSYNILSIHFHQVVFCQ